MSAPSPASSDDPAAPRRVDAVVVTFHPGPDVAANLAAIRGQVDRLLIVDNGSTSAALAALEAFARAPGVTLVRNGVNRGIAAALNQALAWSAAHEGAWLATF